MTLEQEQDQELLQLHRRTNLEEVIVKKLYGVPLQLTLEQEQDQELLQMYRKTNLEESPPNSQQTRAPRLTVRKRKASSNPPGNDQRPVGALETEEEPLSRDIGMQHPTAKDHIIYSRRSDRAIQVANTQKAEAKKKKAEIEMKNAEMEKKNTEAEEAEKRKAEAEQADKRKAEEAEIKRKAAAEEAEKKADAEKKKAEEVENKRKVEAEEAKIKRKVAAEEAMKKEADAEKKKAEEAENKRKAERQQYEDRLNMLRQEAKAEIDSLEKSIDGQAGSSSSFDDIQFPVESDDDINNLTQPIRLSQDEVSVGQADFSEFQRMIFKRLGDRVLKKPREYISPFKIPRNRPEIPLAKAVALRRKIASDPELKSCNHQDTYFATVFVPIKDGAHYFVYCFNFIHKRIDVLDSNEYFLNCSNQEERHKAVFAKIPIIDATFQKVSNLKLPRFKGPIYICELLHYQIFHPLNQAEIPGSLDKFRIGGRPVPIEWDSILLEAHSSNVV
eukprot:XP_023156368.1 uncharacterized protein LOC103633634 [Zea mays]